MSESDNTDLLAARVRNEFNAVRSEIASIPGGGSLNVTTAPYYEYREIWAEENGGMATGQSSEWSYGNGATGYIGIPFDAGWEVFQMYFNADTMAATSIANVDLMSYVTPSNAAANTIIAFTISAADDGGGTTNNAWKVQNYTPVLVPEGPVGFNTRSSSGGTITDVRVGCRFRRKIGDYVTGVTIT